jgi:soluble lytic murein transglycosylase
VALLGAAALGALVFTAPASSQSASTTPAAEAKKPETKKKAEAKKPEPKKDASKDVKKDAKAKDAAKASEKPADKKADAKADKKQAKKRGKDKKEVAAVPAGAPAQSGHNLGPAPAASSPAAPARPRVQLAAAPALATPAIDVAAVKRAIELVRSRRQSDAGDVKNSIGDPVAKKLVEWLILRSDDPGVDFSRYAAFIASSPGWPSLSTLRRKAEALLFQERPSPATVTAYFAANKPLSAKGKFALARALLAQGDSKGAQTVVRDAWRNDGFSADVESRVYEQFGDLLTREDHKARMDRRLYEKDDTDAGLRAANRLGGDQVAIAKARIAMIDRGSNKAALDAVPAAARNDIGYKFARIQYLRRTEKHAEAADVMATVPQLDATHDLDEWWVERRLLARKLLDDSDAKRAYQVARDATTPERDVYRSEHQFTAGWIALRFLNDPRTALAHFQKVGEGNDNPIALSRASYWQGRALEAMGRNSEARAHYQEAAKYPTAYYGQIARAKAGLSELTLNPPLALSSTEKVRLAQLEIVRAAELLYAVDARDHVSAFLADLGDKLDDPGALQALADVAAKYEDPRGMLLIGKLSLARRHPMEHAAFPTVGLPSYTSIGPEVEPALVYSIARQESWFNPKTVSSAKAMGFMQVTPQAGKYLAKKFNVTYDEKRLLSDNVYNMQMGAAELGDVIKDYRGSYILAFAAYNAGRGRVKEWIGRYGDPRDPKVDPIDWVERIPFAETRNYVQRVMENSQVYRVRFGGGSKLLIEADLRRGLLTN